MMPLAMCEVSEYSSSLLNYMSDVAIGGTVNQEDNTISNAFTGIIAGQCSLSFIAQTVLLKLWLHIQFLHAIILGARGPAGLK